MTDVADNPWELSPAHEARIRKRAYHLWEQDGRPDGHAEEYWERARALDALETDAPVMQPNPQASDPDGSANAPVIEQAVLELNLGEFPSLMTDQGDSMPTPETREVARAFREGKR